jgi:hypothetical protein
LFSATQTTKASYKYWSNNIEKWARMIAEKSSSMKSFGYEKDMRTIFKANDQEGFWDAVGDVAIADGIYGASAAVGTAAVNAIPWLGQVSYVSAIVGGAAGGSTASALTKVKNAISDWWNS